MSGLSETLKPCPFCGSHSEELGLVKDFADGWVLFHSEIDARREAEDAGNLVQPLYATPPAFQARVEALEAENAKLRVVASLHMLLSRVGAALEANQWPDVQDLALLNDLHEWWSARAALTGEKGQ